MYRGQLDYPALLPLLPLLPVIQKEEAVQLFGALYTFFFIYFTLPALFLFVGISKTIESGRAEHCVQVHMGLLPGSPYYLTPPLVLFLKLSESFDIVPYEPGYIHPFFLIFSNKSSYCGIYDNNSLLPINLEHSSAFLL